MTRPQAASGDFDTRLASCQRWSTGEVLRLLVTWYSVLFAATFVLGFRDNLDRKYSYDAEKIQSIALGLQRVEDDRSYTNTAYLYSILGLSFSTLAAGVLGFIAFLWLFGIYLSRVEPRSLPWSHVLLGAATLILGAVYLGTFSKEVLILPIAAIAMWRREGKLPEIALVSAMLLYAALFREYWVLVLASYLVLRWVSRRTMSPVYLVSAVALVLAVLAVVFPFTYGDSIDSIREGVNSTRENSPDAQTAIEPLFESGNVAVGWVNTIVVFVSLLAPFPLAVKGGGIYLLATVFIGGIWLTLLFNLARSGAQMHSSSRSAIILVLSFLTVQSIFEPDYGSYVRHLTPMLPLILLTLWECRRVRTIPLSPTLSPQQLS